MSACPVCHGEDYVEDSEGQLMLCPRYTRHATEEAS